MIEYLLKVRWKEGGSTLVYFQAPRGVIPGGKESFAVTFAKGFVARAGPLVRDWHLRPLGVLEEKAKAAGMVQLCQI